MSPLESLNVEICNATGCGKGHATTLAAARRYNREIVRRESEVLAAIAEARKSQNGKSRHYIDGIESALNRAKSTLASNPHQLPFELLGMTQAKWDSLTPAQRDKIRDESDLHPKLKGLEGKTVRVHPPRQHGRSEFRVGKSTGWRPCHLAMKANARGSSDVICEGEQFDRVEVLKG